MKIPKEIQIEPTIKCNNDCIMCNREARMREARDMTLEEFKYIIKQFDSLKKIHMHGIGEPFLNKDFVDMLKHAKKKEIYVCFNTNFSTMTEDLANTLIDLKTDEIRISLDAADKKIYRKIRGFDRFDSVIQNIKMLVALKKKRHSTLPYVKIVVVATKHNLYSISKIVEIAHSLAIEEVFVQNLQSWSKKEFRNTVKKEHSIFYEEYKWREEAFERARITAKILEIKISLPQLKNKKYTCIWPWTSCYISVEGFITPCCNCSDPRTKNMGNIFRNPIKKIWNNSNYNKFRDGISGGNLPDVCKDCIILLGDFKDYHG